MHISGVEITLCVIHHSFTMSFQGGNYIFGFSLIHLDAWEAALHAAKNNFSVWCVSVCVVPACGTLKRVRTRSVHAHNPDHYRKIMRERSLGRIRADGEADGEGPCRCSTSLLWERNK